MNKPNKQKDRLAFSKPVFLFVRPNGWLYNDGEEQRRYSVLFAVDVGLRFLLFHISAWEINIR